MNRNMGGVDRGIRFVIGLTVIGVGVYFQSWWGAVGLLPIGIALMGWCPPYAMFGINTCKR